jgi:hypothetical protein
MYSSIGTLKYHDEKLIVEVDQQLGKYYFNLVPKWFKIHPQKYPPHISVVRKEIPPNKQHWKKYDGEAIEFLYDTFIHNDEAYFWLNAFCTRLEEIRLELGLPVSSPYTRPPSGFHKCFHITIGNTKHDR